MTTHDEAADVARRAGRLSALLQAADVAPRAVEYPSRRIEAAARARHHGVTWRWRAAAAVLVLLTGALAVEPVRAWITGAARTVMHRLAGDPRPQPSAPAIDSLATLEPANSVTFTPPPDLFVLEVSSRQAAGRLTIMTVAGSSAVAEVAGAAGDAELVVMPGGLRIVNRAAASSQYVVRVPASLARVVVRIGRENAVLFTPAPERAPLVIELGRSEASRPF